MFGILIFFIAELGINLQLLGFKSSIKKVGDILPSNVFLIEIELIKLKMLT